MKINEITTTNIIARPKPLAWRRVLKYLGLDDTMVVKKSTNEYWVNRNVNIMNILSKKLGKPGKLTWEKEVFNFKINNDLQNLGVKDIYLATGTSVVTYFGKKFYQPVWKKIKYKLFIYPEGPKERPVAYDVDRGGLRTNRY